jgi:hypothetical protein
MNELLRTFLVRARRRPTTSLLVFFSATVIPILVLFDVPIPKPAWAGDLMKLERNQLDYHIRFMEDHGERLEMRNLQVQRSIHQLQQASKPVPDFYLKEKAIVSGRVAKSKQELIHARKRRLELAK